MLVDGQIQCVAIADKGGEFSFTMFDGPNGTVVIGSPLVVHYNDDAEGQLYGKNVKSVSADKKLNIEI